MPVSSKSGKQWSVNWIKNNQTKIKRVLDLGCGSGTYSKLLKNKNNMLHNAEWVGVEVWTPYIEKYNLSLWYNKIINQDIRSIDYNNMGNFDLCILGDVLEHMTKEESVDVVNKVLEISSRIIISIPIVHFPQDDVEGNPFEVHVKDDWSDQEVKETFPNIIDSFVQNKIGVYLLGKKEF